MRLIDADSISNVLQEKIVDFTKKLLDEIDENPDNPYAGSTAAFAVGLLKCVKDMLIDTAPTIEAEPVRHGEWGLLYGTYGPKVCSECGEEAPTVLMGSEYEESQYCPTCGAKMDGKENEE